MPMRSLEKLLPYLGAIPLPPKRPRRRSSGHLDAVALVQTDWFCDTGSESESERNSRVTRPKIRVLLADDCSQLRRLFIDLLAEFPDIEIAGEASNGRAAVELAKLLVPDVVIMDINMPEMDGIEATRNIRNSLPHIGVVGLSMTDDVDCRNKMRQAGADDFVSKIEPLDVLITALRTYGHPRRS
jgi:CheY-like chemotaxis protein